MASRVFAGPAAPVDRDDISRMAPDGRLPDGTFDDRMAMFIGSASDGRYCVSAVFTDEVHHLGPVERTTLAVRMTMPATAQTRVKNTKENVHDIPASILAHSRAICQTAASEWTAKSFATPLPFALCILDRTDGIRVGKSTSGIPKVLSRWPLWFLD